MPASTGRSAGNRALTLATISFAISFAAWGLAAAFASLLCFALNAGLLRYLRRLERPTSKR